METTQFDLIQEGHGDSASLFMICWYKTRARSQARVNTESSKSASKGSMASWCLLSLNANACGCIISISPTIKGAEVSCPSGLAQTGSSS